MRGVKVKSITKNDAGFVANLCIDLPPGVTAYQASEVIRRYLKAVEEAKNAVGEGFDLGGTQLPGEDDFT